MDRTTRTSIVRLSGRWLKKKSPRYAEADEPTSQSLDFWSDNWGGSRSKPEAFVIKFLADYSILQHCECLLQSFTWRANCKIKNSHFFNQNVFHNLPGDVEGETETGSFHFTVCFQRQLSVPAGFLHLVQRPSSLSGHIQDIPGESYRLTRHPCYGYLRYHF